MLVDKSGAVSPERDTGLMKIDRDCQLRGVNGMSVIRAGT